MKVEEQKKEVVPVGFRKMKKKEKKKEYEEQVSCFLPRPDLLCNQGMIVNWRNGQYSIYIFVVVIFDNCLICFYVPSGNIC